MAKQKKAPWCRARHKVVRNIAYALLYPYAKLKYGITIHKFKEQGDRPYLILYNHQTAFDQFFVGMAFCGATYYLASEDLFSNGFVSSLIRYLVAPIPIKKQALDIGALKSCVKVAREGGTIAIAPEGNRTYSGKTEYISPSIAPLARRLGLPIALYRIEGGYGVHPRWSDVVRRGKMHAYVSRVIEPAEYAALSDEELFSLIRDGLYVNEAVADGPFHHKKRAEYLERLLYVCPFCGPAEFESQGTQVRCKSCGRRVTYEPTKELSGVGFELPFRFVNDWYEYQKTYISQMEPAAHTASPLFTDTARLYEVILGKRKIRLRKAAAFRLYGDRITVDETGPDPLLLPFADTFAVAVLGKNKLNIYHGDKVYQVRGTKRFNAIKYVNLFYRHKNITNGEQNGKFLGL